MAHILKVNVQTLLEDRDVALLDLISLRTGKVSRSAVLRHLLRQEAQKPEYTASIRRMNDGAGAK